MPVSYPWERDKGLAAPRFLAGLAYDEMAQMVSHWGFKEANARQLFIGLHRRGWRDFNDFKSSPISPKLLGRLAMDSEFPLAVFKGVEAHPSRDQSVKYLFTLNDGARIESVYMPFGKHATFCISSQVGCALGCTFCATGTMGFKRHLDAAEIISQVTHMRRLHLQPSGQSSRFNVVFMGMGEPLHNLGGVMKAFEIMTHPNGLVLSPKDIAVSTSGLVPRINELARQPRRPRLMVSIAHTTDAQRSAIMPVNRAYPLELLLSTLECFPLAKREKIMLSYVLIAGENDSPEDVTRLAAMSRRFPSLVNLIPMNEHQASPGMLEPEEAAIQTFASSLLNLGVFTTIRRSRGRDVAGACGQLVI